MPKYSLLLFTINILLLGFSAYSQKQGAAIILHDEKLNFTPREFYIADVADERSERNIVASVIENNEDHAALIDLKGGAAIAIKNFLDHNLHRDTTLRPVLITLKQFKLIETNAAGGYVNGKLDVIFSFARRFKYDTVHLVNYEGGLTYSRPEKQAAGEEATLRHGIERALSYFNTWINSQAETNPLLAKKVKVSFTDYTEKPEGDTIYYSVNRPLTWDDFRDKPRDERFEAEVFTGIGYIEHNEALRGIIHVNMAIKVEVAKSDCWVKTGGGDSYVLNHEQRHFDIEKLVSEHFKQKLQAMDLPVDNFYGPINVEYLETLREATRIQKQYDAETRHGRDRQEQERWNEKIDKELIGLGIKK